MKAGLLDEAKRLSVDERIELAEAISDTIPADVGTEVLPLADAHRRELDRRSSSTSSAAIDRRARRAGR